MFIRKRLPWDVVSNESESLHHSQTQWHWIWRSYFSLFPSAVFDIVPPTMPVDSSSSLTTPQVSLTGNQIRGFWAAWGGWTLDGMDSFIYALVLLPSLRELLPRSGIAATKGNVGYYGGLLFALFLVGWGL